jgi:hypothetical protein
MTFPGSAALSADQMRRCVLSAVAALGIMTFAAGSMAAQANTVSGRAVGEMTPSFPVLAVSGPHKGKLICYVCESNGAPIVFAFFRQTGDETASMLRKLDELAKTREVRVVAVMIEGPDSRPWLEKVAAKYGITIPLAVLRNGKENVAVNLYRLNPGADNTILFSVNRKVVANLVNVNALNFGMLANAVASVTADQRNIGAKQVR